MIASVKIERYKDYEELVRVLSHSEAAPATNKDLLQPLHYSLLIGTHVPEQYQNHLGALIVLLFKDPKVVDVSVWQNDFGVWFADSVIETGRGHRLRQGKGATPIEAFIELVYDIQRY